VPADDDATLQDELEAAGPAGARLRAPSVADPAALLAHLEASGHFHRDGRAGRIYHAGQVSLREDVPTDSLHVSVDDNRVRAHVDEASPLAVTPGPSRYSLPRAVAHNLLGMGGDLLAIVRGRQGDHSCELDCQWVSAEVGGAPAPVRRLDPATSAWGVQLDVRVAGSLDEARLRRALDAVAGRRGAGEECLTIVDCDGDDALDLARRRLHGSGVPLTVVPPVHACLAHHPDGDVLMLNLNHAAVDGFGAAQVLGTLARAYAHDGDAPAPREFLACADLPVQATPPSGSRIARTGRRAIERVRDALSQPRRLAADGAGEAGAAGDRAGYGFHLRALPAGSGTPTRDALIAALHLAIAEWNDAHDMPGRRIGVLVPVDLRPDELPEHVVANLSINTRLSTTRRERATPAAAQRAIAWHAERDKGTRTGVALIAALQRAGMLTLWAKQSTVVLQPLTGNRSADAAMLCDLGGVEPSFGADAGDVREVWFSPPSRSPRCLCLGAVTVAGRLHLTFRYPYALFGADAVRRFAEGYVGQLERVIASSS
jgi:hypothetical protein